MLATETAHSIVHQCVRCGVVVTVAKPAKNVDRYAFRRNGAWTGLFPWCALTRSFRRLKKFVADMATESARCPLYPQ